MNRNSIFICFLTHLNTLCCEPLRWTAACRPSVVHNWFVITLEATFFPFVMNFAQNICLSIRFWSNSNKGLCKTKNKVTKLNQPY